MSEVQERLVGQAEGERGGVMKPEGIVTDYSAWKPLFVSPEFMAALCGLSGHVGHMKDRNQGWFCASREVRQEYIDSPRMGRELWLSIRDRHLQPK